MTRPPIPGRHPVPGRGSGPGRSRLGIQRTAVRHPRPRAVLRTGPVRPLDSRGEVACCPVHRAGARAPLSYVVMLAVAEFLARNPDGRLSGNATDRAALVNQIRR